MLFTKSARWLALLAALAVSPAFASETMAQQDFAGAALRFDVFRLCNGSSPRCGDRILVSGELPDDAARQFLDYLDAAPRYSPVVCFDSIGGSVRGGISLGRVIRARALDTCVLRTYSTETLNHDSNGNLTNEETVLADGAICASACVFAFMGGVNREVAPGAMLGVHQFAGTYSEVLAQITEAQIGSFVDEMGVSRALLDTASRTPPWDLYWLQPADLLAMGLDTTRGSTSPWTLEASNAGAVFATATVTLPQSTRSVVTIYIGDVSEPRAIIRFTPADGHSDLALQALDGRTIRLLVDGEPIGETVLSRWTSEGARSLFAEVRLYANCRTALAKGAVLHIFTDVAHVTYQYDASADVPVAGIQRFLPAILAEPASTTAPNPVSSDHVGTSVWSLPHLADIQPLALLIASLVALFAFAVLALAGLRKILGLLGTARSTGDSRAERRP